MSGTASTPGCRSPVPTRLTGPNAGLSFDAKLDLLWSVDVVATIRLCRAIGRRMKAQGRGSIVTMGWDQAETGMEGDSGELFAATKGAVMAFTRSLSLSLAPEVRVNALAPGWIKTAWGETASSPWQDRVLRETPLARWGTPEDVARVACFLVSPAAQFVTGQVVRINGGGVRIRFDRAALNSHSSPRREFVAWGRTLVALHTLLSVAPSV